MLYSWIVLFAICDLVGSTFLFFFYIYSFAISFYETRYTFKTLIYFKQILSKMAENMVNLTKNIIPESTGVILLIDHDAISVASLIPMLKQRSHKGKTNHSLKFSLF